MFAVTRIHPHLLATREGPIIQNARGVNQLIHLRQSDLDQACGPHCLFMALLILKLLDRRQVTMLALHAQNTRTHKVWKGSKRLFFSGADPIQLHNILRPMQERVECMVTLKRHADACAFAIDHLAHERLVVLGLQNAKLGLAHWTLAIGVEGIESDGQLDIQRLLLLDPDDACLPMLAWNSTVTVCPQRSRERFRVFTDSTGQGIPVTFDSALAIGLAK